MTTRRLLATCLLGLPLLTGALDVAAVTCTSHSGARNWNTAGSWNCVHVPVDGDAVIIAGGSTVTLDVHSNRLASLVINMGGILTIGSGKSYDIFLGGNLVNNGTIDFLVSNAANTIYLAGNNVVSTFSGTGTWLLDNLDLNGKSSDKCTGSCYVELAGSPNLQFNNGSLFAALSADRGFNTLGNATATVTFIRAGAQQIATNNVAYPNLVLAGSGIKTSKNGDLNILGSLTVASGTTFNANNNDPTIHIAGSVIIDNGGIYVASSKNSTTIAGNFSNSGTYTGNNGLVTLSGSFSNTGSFVSGSGTWTFQGTMGQSIGGTSNFENLALDNASGLTLNNDVTVSTVLTLNSGNLTTGVNTLFASADCPGSVTRGSGHVIGKLRLMMPSTNPVTCVFPVGDVNNYAPITLTKSGTNSGTLTGNATMGDHADTTAGTSGINASKSVNNYWTLTGGTLPSGTSYDATFQFCTSAGPGCNGNALDSGSNTSGFIVANKATGSWATPTVGIRTGSTTQATGLSSFGDFAVGEAGLPAGGPHHFEIRHVSGSGMTCAPSTLTITACQDAGCTSPYTGGMTGTLAAAGAPTVNWVSGADFSVPSGSSSTHVSVQLTTPGSVVFGISGSSPAPVNSTICNFGSPACTFTAADAGFLMSISDHVAETSEMVTVSAIKKADNSLACTPAFASVSKAVTFTCAYQNPATGTLPLRVGGRALNAANSAGSACDGTGQSVTLAFNGSGVATTTLQYADVGEIRLNARYAGGSGSEAGLVMTGSDSLIAAPASFGFSAVTPAPIKSGKTFGATVTALNVAGDATPNFGQETPAEGVTLSHLRIQPTGTGAVDGVFSGGVGSFAYGSANASNLSWSEVGMISLRAALAGASYLGSGLTASGSSNAGPFVPDHFDTVVTQGCVSGGFTYSAQPFVAQIKAMNGAGVPAVTQNYDGTVNTAPNFAKTVTLSDGNSVGLGTLASAAVPATHFAAGIGHANPAYSFVDVKTSPTTIKLRAADVDASSAGFIEGTANIRGGRLRLQNAYGSELLDLPVGLEAQYWTGSYFARHTSDDCTQVPVPTAGGGLIFGGNLTDGETTPSLNGATSGQATLAAGDGLLTFTAPGAGNDGFVDVTLDAPSWLEYDWKGTGSADPTGRATFGIYQTSTIYLRENY